MQRGQDIRAESTLYVALHKMNTTCLPYIELTTDLAKEGAPLSYAANPIRFDDFDTAFESQIRRTIRYPSLGIPSRLCMWKAFVWMGELESRLSEKDLETLVKIQVNRRQIRNIVKTACLLQKQEKVP